MEKFQKGPVGKAGAKKNIMREFRMDEISIVDVPAQGQALITMMKRKEDEVSVEKLRVMSTIVNAHQHVVDVREYNLEEGGGHSSYASSGGTDEHDHGHDYVIGEDGTIEMSINHGHTHEVDMYAFIQRMRMLEVITKYVMKSGETSAEAHSPSDYGYVPDPNNPESWEFRLTKTPGGKPDRRLVGQVANSLAKRGVLRAIPVRKRDVVIRRVRRAWIDSNPNKPHSSMPSVLKRSFVQLT